MNVPTIIDQSVDHVFKFTTDIETQLAQCQYMTRISYRYEDSESKASPRQFVQSLINSHHYEPLEFVSIYADLSSSIFASLKSYLEKKAADGKDAHVRLICKDAYAFTLREVVEHWNATISCAEKFSLESAYMQALTSYILSDDALACFMNDPEIDFSKFIRVKWVCTTNRQIATEITRHRCLSKNWESTRHCLYNKDRFKGLTMCDPKIYHKLLNGSNDADEVKAFLSCMNSISGAYMKLVEIDKAQAAYVLPSCTAVKVAFAGYIDDVKNVILMRTTNYCGAPHVDANALMVLVNNELAGQFEWPYGPDGIDKEEHAGKASDDISPLCADILSVLGDDITPEMKARIAAKFHTQHDSGRSCGCNKCKCKQEKSVKDQKTPTCDTSNKKHDSLKVQLLEDPSYRLTLAIATLLGSR